MIRETDIKNILHELTLHHKQMIQNIYSINEGFDQIDEQFAQVDQKFEQMNKWFEQVNQSLEVYDQYINEKADNPHAYSPEFQITSAFY